MFGWVFCLLWFGLWGVVLWKGFEGTWEVVCSNSNALAVFSTLCDSGVGVGLKEVNVQAVSSLLQVVLVELNYHSS